MSLLSAIQKVLPEVTAFRQARHQDPELTWQETRTAQAIAAALRPIPGLTVQEGVAKWGVVATLTGKRPGPVVALRADMDALPVQEQTDLPYRSQNAGVMHACGHDGHMAVLYGAARVLSSIPEQISGTVKFIFQPAEERGAGAKAMIQAGVLDGVDAIFGLHGWPSTQVGEVTVRPGAQMAALAEVHVTISGKGCHGAMPHLGTDQILIAARFIEAAQAIRSRVVAPTEPMVLTFGSIHGGSAMNVIPDEVKLTGSLRTFSSATEALVTRHLQQLAEGLGRAAGATIDVQVKPELPPVLNDPAATAYFEKVAEQMLGAEKVHRLPTPEFVSEDFSYFLQKVPGTFFFLGMNEGKPGSCPSLHHPAYNFNDRSLATGIGLFCQLALDYGKK